MLCLRQQVGGDERRVGIGIGNDTYLRRTGGHIDSHVVKAHFLLGSHDILVAWTEYLIYLGHRLRAVSHCTNGLHTASLEDMAHSGNACGDEDGGVDLALTVGRGAKHNLAASGNLGGCGEHQYGAEQRCRSARNVESNLVDRYALLPAGDTGLGVYFLSHEFF